MNSTWTVLNSAWTVNSCVVTVHAQEKKKKKEENVDAAKRGMQTVTKYYIFQVAMIEVIFS